MTKEKAHDKSVEDDAVAIDQVKLTEHLLDQRMKAYVVYNAEEHRQTRKEVKELNGLICRVAVAKFHTYVQYVLIGSLFLIMLVCMTSC